MRKPEKASPSKRVKNLAPKAAHKIKGGEFNQALSLQSTSTKKLENMEKGQASKVG